MPEPEPILFSCIGCGALNPPDARACSGCGHVFGGPDLLAPAGPGPILPAPRPRPGNPSAAPVARGPGLQISTVMLLVALVAVCVWGFTIHTGWGILVSLGVIPASTQVALLTARGRREGRPLPIGDKVGLFFLFGVLTYRSACVAMAAFALACVPIGLVSDNIPVTFLGGGLAGGYVAFQAMRAGWRLALSIVAVPRRDPWAR